MEFKFPDVGEGIAEGEVVKWLVSEGDEVSADQNIVQIETDKAVADIPSPISGKILKINFKEGSTVKVGEVLCVIGKDGDKVNVQNKFEKKLVKKVNNQNIRGKIDMKGDVQELKQSVVSKGEDMNGKVLATPAVRKLAKEMNVNLSGIKGSGDSGRILKSDLDKSGNNAEIPQQKIIVKKKYDEFGYVERIPLKGIRKTIAENMIKVQTEAAQVTAMEDIEVTKLWDLRRKEKTHFEIEGIKLTFMPFIAKACIAALQENPILNSVIEGEEIILRKYYNLGIAVETEVGLMVPVIKIAEKKSVAQIAKEIQDLAEKARSRKIDVMDLKGSTFTITNYGSVGGNYGTPILNVGNAAVLGIGRIFDRVVLNNKTGKLSNSKILPVSLTFDHRILDGAEAARFLESLRKFLEDPEHLFQSRKRKNSKF